MKCHLFLPAILLLLGCSSAMDHAVLEQINYRDTLILSTTYCDCGEWGGHYEKMYIYRDSDLYVKYIKDTVNCVLDDVVHKPYFTGVKKINSYEANLIEHYIRQVDRLSKEEQEPCANAANIFAVTFRDKRTEYIDMLCTDWDQFYILPQQLFGVKRYKFIY